MKFPENTIACHAERSEASKILRFAQNDKWKILCFAQDDNGFILQFIII
ncbi:MAG: hypothetical protein HOO91_10285 [Bacteroidales bacterium]|nr:hypothetical protein [Bacteroidales bacterium]